MLVGCFLAQPFIILSAYRCLEIAGVLDTQNIYTSNLSDMHCHEQSVKRVCNFR